MGKRYSHSKVASFEQCPYKYKLRYIERRKPDYETSIEGFMGSLVHTALEELHKRLMAKRSVTKQGMLRLYNTLWEEGYHEGILIAKKDGPEGYRRRGEFFLETYYDKYYPFDQLEIIELETEDLLTLPDGSEWHVRIDKFAKDKEGNFYVIDYKTNARLKDRSEIEEDRQLAMYSIWVKENFPEAKKVKLVWQMLALNESIESERSEEDLKKLIEEMVVKISKIENAKEFPAKITALCNYCNYSESCEFYQESLKNKHLL